MGTLHVWTADKHDWVVAESAEDACAEFCRVMGFDVVNAPNADDSVDFGRHPSQWTQLPDDEPLQMSEECPELHAIVDEDAFDQVKADPCPKGCDDNFIIHHKKTCAEWAAEGPAYLGSADL